jgi:hypothetical protein
MLKYFVFYFVLINFNPEKQQGAYRVPPCLFGLRQETNYGKYFNAAPEVSAACIRSVMGWCRAETGSSPIARFPNVPEAGLIGALRNEACVKPTTSP